jgi:cell division septal protein FtsQ
MPFLRRRPKNRRLAREHVLDVKLRSSQVRAARSRMAAIALGVVFALVFGTYLAFRTVHWALDRLVYENVAFAIETIDVQTDGVLAVSQIRSWADVKSGQNLLALDLARVKRDLELVSVIQAASVERVLPHTLRLRITEREPLAQMNVRWQRPGSTTLETAVFQLDPNGYVMLPIEPRQRATPVTAPEPLPTISGLDGSLLQPGRRLESPQLQAALQLLVAFDHSPMAGLVEISSIDVTSPEVLVVKTGQGSEITFGLADLDHQLRRWRTVADATQLTGKAIAALDLAVTNNPPLRWLEASAVPPTPVRPPKTLRSHKKHV